MRFSTAAAACYKNVFSAGHPEKCNYGFCVQITIIHKSPLLQSKNYSVYISLGISTFSNIDIIIYKRHFFIDF